MTKRSPFRYFKTSPEVIRLAVMLYVRFPLSLRNVEDLLLERGIDVIHETIRYWWNRFGPLFTAEIRRRTTAIRPHSPNTTSSCVSQLAVTRSVISRMVIHGAYRTPASLPRTLTQQPKNNTLTLMYAFKMYVDLCADIPPTDHAFDWTLSADRCSCSTKRLI